MKKDECPYGSEWSDTDRPNIKLPPKSQRIVVRVDSYVAPRSISTEKYLIPRTIIQTNEKDEIPKKMMDATNTLINLNPEYEYVYFTDDEAKTFILNNFDQSVNDAYNKLNPGAYKADLFRYCFLWINGGVYIDMGMVGLASLNTVIKPTDTFIAPEDNGANSIYNAFMACTPHHPIVREAIILAVENIENNDYTHNPLGITGPLLLGKAFEKITGEPVSPGRDYGNGIRIIKFSKYNKCESGIIHSSGVNILATRYPSYRIDQIWYNTKPHYSDLWKNRKVFK